MTLITCIVMWIMHGLCVPHTIQVWGIVSFIVVGFCQSLYLVDEINSTLSFCLQITILELYGFG